MAKNSKNYTFSLPVELMDKAWLGLQIQKAASDPIFIEDLNACMKDFEIADNEALPERICRMH